MLAHHQTFGLRIVDRWRYRHLHRLGMRIGDHGCAAIWKKSGSYQRHSSFNGHSILFGILMGILSHILDSAVHHHVVGIVLVQGLLRPSIKIRQRYDAVFVRLRDFNIVTKMARHEKQIACFYPVSISPHHHRGDSSRHLRVLDEVVSFRAMSAIGGSLAP